MPYRVNGAANKWLPAVGAATSASSVLDISGALSGPSFGALLSANLILFGAAWPMMTITKYRKGGKNEVEWY